MSSALERAIDALTGPAATTAEALRSLLVVARRIEADDVSAWLRAELGGFEAGADVPAYRVIPQPPIEVHFDGFGGSWRKLTTYPHELGEELGSAAQNMQLRQPVAELVELAGVDDVVRSQLPMLWVMRYRALAERGEVPYLEMMLANSASISLPRTYITGVLDRIKSVALELALDIESASRDAGRADGPTTSSDADLARAVESRMTTIYATNSTITVGDRAAVATGERSTAGQTVVQVGDVSGLLDAARGLLSEDGINALKEALESDGGEPSSATRSFLDRVKAGAYGLAAGVTANGAYDGLVNLLTEVFPGLVL